MTRRLLTAGDAVRLDFVVGGLGVRLKGDRPPPPQGLAVSALLSLSQRQLRAPRGLCAVSRLVLTPAPAGLSPPAADALEPAPAPGATGSSSDELDELELEPELESSPLSLLLSLPLSSLLSLPLSLDDEDETTARLRFRALTHVARLPSDFSFSPRTGLVRLSSLCGCEDEPLMEGRRSLIQTSRRIYLPR